MGCKFLDKFKARLAFVGAKGRDQGRECVRQVALHWVVGNGVIGPERRVIHVEKTGKGWGSNGGVILLGAGPQLRLDLCNGDHGLFPRLVRQR